MLSVLMLGGSIGAGTRGLMGLRNLLSPNPDVVDTQSSIPVQVPIHLGHRPQPQEEENKTGMPFSKAAVFDARPDGGINWWELPGGTLAGAGGLYGGWKLVDWLMDKRRKAQQSSALERARGDYEKALQEQYASAMAAKNASNDGPSLDAVYDHLTDAAAMQAHLEKVAVNPASVVRDVGHYGAGAYLTALMALTGLSGIGTYNWSKSNSRAKALEKALKRRRQARSAPQPFAAVPQYDDGPM